MKSKPKKKVVKSNDIPWHIAAGTGGLALGSSILFGEIKVLEELQKKFKDDIYNILKDISVLKQAEEYIDNNDDIVEEAFEKVKEEKELDEEESDEEESDSDEEEKLQEKIKEAKEILKKIRNTKGKDYIEEAKNWSKTNKHLRSVIARKRKNLTDYQKLKILKARLQIIEDYEKTTKNKYGKTKGKKENKFPIGATLATGIASPLIVGNIYVLLTSEVKKLANERNKLIKEKKEFEKNLEKNLKKLNKNFEKKHYKRVLERIKFKIGNPGIYDNINQKNNEKRKINYGKTKKSVSKKIEELEQEINKLKKDGYGILEIISIIASILLVIYLSISIPIAIKRLNSFGKIKKTKLKKIIMNLSKKGMKPDEIISITLSSLMEKIPKKESKKLGKIIWKDVLRRSSYGKTKKPKRRKTKVKEPIFGREIVKDVSKQFLNKKARVYWIKFLKTIWHHSERDKPRGLFDYLKYSYKDSRKKQFGKKKIKRNSIMKKEKISSTLKKMCKKLGVRLTVKRKGKRVYKSVKVLKKQCANKKKKKSKRKFGAARRDSYARPASSFGNVQPFYNYTVGSPVRFGSRRPHKHPLRYAFYNPAKTDEVFRQ